jgi:hypothetical protein
MDATAKTFRYLDADEVAAQRNAARGRRNDVLSTVSLCQSVAFAIAACGWRFSVELREWMTEQKSQTFPKVTPIAEPKVFKPGTLPAVGRNSILSVSKS